MLRKLAIWAIMYLTFLTAVQTGFAKDMPVWELNLRDQLLAEKQCNLNYLTGVKIQKLGIIESVEARAHCMNGQAYDVRSLGGVERFEIHSCGMSVC